MSITHSVNMCMLRIFHWVFSWEIWQHWLELFQSVMQLVGFNGTKVISWLGAICLVCATC
jgi:hypothetical protein